VDAMDATANSQRGRSVTRVVTYAERRKRAMAFDTYGIILIRGSCKKYGYVLLYCIRIPTRNA